MLTLSDGTRKALSVLVLVVSFMLFVGPALADLSGLYKPIDDAGKDMLGVAGKIATAIGGLLIAGGFFTLSKSVGAGVGMMAIGAATIVGGLKINVIVAWAVGLAG